MGRILFPANRQARHGGAAAGLGVVTPRIPGGKRGRPPKPNAAVPLRITRLIAALSQLGDPAVAERQAQTIYSVMLKLLASYASRGHNIGRDAGGFFARPRTATAGPAR